LIESPATQEPDSGTTLRNPLQQPRHLPEDLRRQEEARWITQRIQNLIETKTLIGSPEQSRPVRYGDIVILLRSRTHAHAYENALREEGIPFLGAGRGTLLESLEVRDMEALLNILVTPYNNLDLAQVLRSPIFAISNDDLVALAQDNSGPWIVRLERLSANLPEHHLLFRANKLLTEWRELAGHTPVHDLLDHIYHSANIPARYRSAYPAPLRSRVITNLTRFIELALDVDSGRYPSLPRFLNRLQGLRNTELDGPDETPPDLEQETRVRVMTIHGAKGLEAPAVFVADTAASLPPHRPYSALMDWPADAQRPDYFLLAGPESARDNISSGLLRQQEQPEMREEANLLYVALTRAKQLLFLSGSASKRNRDTGWYSVIRDRMIAAGAEQQDGTLVLRSGTAPVNATSIAAANGCEVEPEAGLSKPIIVQQLTQEIAPSHVVDRSECGDSDNLEARQRGIAIHFMLERLTSYQDPSVEQLLIQSADHLQRTPEDPVLLDWWNEACRVWSEPRFARLFRIEHYQRAYNEVPIQYFVDGTLVYGIIDRLIEYEQEALIIDYKSHRHASPDSAQRLAQDYANQLHLYAEGVRRIWPQKTVKTGVLFTACNELISLD
jgi:ATP-dependent helicase/nuclease subunit A